MKKGKKKQTSRVFGAVFCFLGLLCLIYFIWLMVHLGASNTFNFFWLLSAFVFGGFGLVLVFAKGALSRLPRWLLFLIEGIVAVGCFVFIFVEIIIISWGNKTAGEADYVIVLGAKVNRTNPSLSLKARLDTAVIYLNRYPNAQVIVSGGQGADEEISEAECMYNYLVAAGISKERIIQENQSTSTLENLEFSAKLFDIRGNRVVIITNDFHVFRSVQIARKAGYTQVSGQAAPSLWYLVPTNYVREFLAVVKDYFIGNM